MRFDVALTILRTFDVAAYTRVHSQRRRIHPMPRWLHRVLNGAVGFAIPVFDRIFVWPPQTEDIIDLVSLLVHEERHLQDGWRAWVYAVWSVWNTRLREYEAYATELAFLERLWPRLDEVAAVLDGFTVEHPTLATTPERLRETALVRLRWLRRVLHNLEDHGRLT